MIEVGMAQADQIEVLTWCLDNVNRVEAGKRALGAAFATHAGDAGRRDVSGVAKAAGCTVDQVDAWLRREWSPATGQTLALMRAVAEYADRFAGLVTS